MKLADYLSKHEIKRTDFAERIGVSPQTITGWCDHAFWPSRGNAMRIFEETSGAVTPTDFLKQGEGSQ